MNLLLDTQAWLWFVLDDERLSARVRERLVSETDAVFVSPASYWEIAIKISLNKYQLECPFAEFLTAAIEGSGLQTLPIEPRHVEVVARLPFHHRDPFDRLLIAQAISERIEVATNDEAFQQYGVNVVW